MASRPGPATRGAPSCRDQARAARPPGLWTNASFGEPLPERVVRAIVLARLANLVDGHSAARPPVAAAVAAILNGGPLPAVPARGNGGSGEILALGHLFGDVADRLDLEPREKMALINGSPCAAALVADAALAGRGRLKLAEGQRSRRSVEAIVRAPLEAFAPELGDLWGDEHEAQALASFASLLEGGARERQEHQAPVSYRVLPRVLGRLREGAGPLPERTASVSLASVTDNPVFLPPSEGRPLGALISNGGYQPTTARIPRSTRWRTPGPDVAQLAQRPHRQFFQHPVSAPPLAGEWLVKPLHMVGAGYAEEARSAAQTTVLGLGGFGQNDLPSPVFLAWRKATAAGDCLERILAVLAALASQRPPTVRGKPHRRPLAHRYWIACASCVPPVDHASPVGHRHRASGPLRLLAAARPRDGPAEDHRLAGFSRKPAEGLSAKRQHGGGAPAELRRRCARPERPEWGEQDSNLRRHSHQVYSLTPLATRTSPRGVFGRRL